MFAGANLAQWVIAIFSGGTFLGVLRFLTNWRSLTHSAEKVLRDHYASELARLTKRIEEKDEHILRIESHLRDMVKTADERYEECQRERSEDRAQIGRLQEEIAGLRRQVPQISADALLIMGDDASGKAPEASKAARRVKILGDK